MRQASLGVDGVKARVRRGVALRGEGGAALIARFCAQEQPPIWTPPSAEVQEQQALVRRVEMLQEMLQEENRRQSGGSSSAVRASIGATLTFLRTELAQTQRLVQQQLERSAELRSQQQLLCSGHVQACWSVALLTAYLSMRFHVVLSCVSVRRLLHRMGWRWRRPRLATARKPDPEAQAKRTALAQATEQARQELAHLLYLDESDLHLLPLIRAMWMKGPRRRIPTPGTDRRRAFFGALDAVSGQ